jgi:hypothetical protein
MYSRLAIIPSLYVITIAVAFFVNVQVASIFPIIIVPTMVSLAKIFGYKMKKRRRKENTSL